MQNDIFKLENGKVLVIGDIMLDTYYEGDAYRISPEAPVPVVKIEKKAFKNFLNSFKTQIFRYRAYLLLSSSSNFFKTIFSASRYLLRSFKRRISSLRRSVSERVL